MNFSNSLLFFVNFPIVMETFDLTNMHRNTIQIYDEHGSKFDKEVLEYFLLLFPNPQKLFFVRLDTSAVINTTTTTTLNNGIAPLLDDPMDRKAFMVSKSRNKIRETTNTHTEAVPVRRQNCFIGQWPGTNANMESSLNAISTATTNRHLSNTQQSQIMRGLARRVKMLQDSQYTKRHTITTPTIVKRSMRI